MVTAMSLGPLLRAPRQRAASIINAVESGPPDTASTNAGNSARSEKSALASAIETGLASCVGMLVSGNRDPLVGVTPLAMHALLFRGDAALHASRGARVFALDFGERRAGRFLLLHGGERLAETQQRIGRLVRLLIF